MSLTRVGIGTVPTGTGTNTGTGTTATCNAVAGRREGDLEIVFVHAKPDTTTINTPASGGWATVPNGSAAGGGGTTGLDTGPTKVSSFWRAVPAGASNFSTTVSGQNAWQTFGITYRAPAWDYLVAGANGIDTTTGTPFTAAMNVDPGIAVGDMVAVFGGIPTDVSTPTQFSAETLTATGLTSGAITFENEPETTQGNDLGGVVVEWTPTGGPSSGVATFSATAGGTTTNVRGPIILVRVRENVPAAPVARDYPSAADALQYPTTLTFPTIVAMCARCRGLVADATVRFLVRLSTNNIRTPGNSTQDLQFFREYATTSGIWGLTAANHGVNFNDGGEHSVMYTHNGHAAAGASAADVNVWIDGVDMSSLVTMDTAPAGALATGPWYWVVGNGTHDGTGTANWGKPIGYAYLDDATPSTAEAIAHHLTGSPGWTTTMVEYQDYQGVDPVTDSSGNGRTGTVFGTHLVAPFNLPVNETEHPIVSAVA